MPQRRYDVSACVFLVMSAHEKVMWSVSFLALFLVLSSKGTRTAQLTRRTRDDFFLFYEKCKFKKKQKLCNSPLKVCHEDSGSKKKKKLVEFTPDTKS